jgi:hypothetical protein
MTRYTLLIKYRLNGASTSSSTVKSCPFRGSRGAQTCQAVYCQHRQSIAREGGRDAARECSRLDRLGTIIRPRRAPVHDAGSCCRELNEISEDMFPLSFPAAWMSQTGFRRHFLRATDNDNISPAITNMKGSTLASPTCDSTAKRTTFAVSNLKTRGNRRCHAGYWTFRRSAVYIAKAPASEEERRPG